METEGGAVVPSRDLLSCRPASACVTACRGALASLSRRSAQSTSFSAQRVSGALAVRGGQQAQRDEARCHLDSDLASAAVLGDGEGYRRALRMLCKNLAEAGDEGRLREVRREECEDEECQA